MHEVMGTHLHIGTSARREKEMYSGTFLLHRPNFSFLEEEFLQRFRSKAFVGGFTTASKVC